MIIPQNTPFRHQPSDGWGEKGCPEKIKKFQRLLRGSEMGFTGCFNPSRRTYRLRHILSSPPFFSLESRCAPKSMVGWGGWQIENFNSNFSCENWIHTRLSRRPYAELALKPHRVFVCEWRERLTWLVIRLRDVESICGKTFFSRSSQISIRRQSLAMENPKSSAEISIFDWDLSRTWCERWERVRLWYDWRREHFALDLLRNLSSHA